MFVGVENTEESWALVAEKINKKLLRVSEDGYLLYYDVDGKIYFVQEIADSDPSARRQFDPAQTSHESSRVVRELYPQLEDVPPPDYDPNWNAEWDGFFQLAQTPEQQKLVVKRFHEHTPLTRESPAKYLVCDESGVYDRAELGQVQSQVLPDLVLPDIIQPAMDQYWEEEMDVESSIAPESGRGGDVTIEDLEHEIENVVAMMHMRDTRITESMESLRETVADHMVHLGQMQAREMRELREQVLPALAGKGGKSVHSPKSQ